MFFTLGRPWHFSGLKVGAQVSLLYNSDRESILKTSNKFDVSNGEHLVKDESAVTIQLEQEYKTGGLLDLGIESGDALKIQLSQLLIQNSSNTTSQKESERKSDSVSKKRITTLNWTERKLQTQQMIVSGNINNSEYKFNYSIRGQLAKANRQEPDSREYTYLLRDNKWELNTDSTGNRRTWSILNDRTEEWAIDTTTQKNLGTRNFKVFLGFNRQNRLRRSDTTRLHFRNRFKDIHEIDLSAPPDEIFKDKNIKPDGFVLTNLTETADSMGGEQEIKAGYLSTAIEIIPTLSFDTGIRLEETRMMASTFFYFAPDQPTSKATLIMHDILPAHSLTWNANPNHKLRLAYSETIARPEFREISTIPFIDDESGYETVGNDKLMGTIINNWDLRWEYYWNAEDSTSVGIFTKNLKKPIEEIFEPSPNLRKTYTNAERAENRGVEFDTQLGLGQFSRELRRWSILGNVSLIDSQIFLSEEAQGVQTSNHRPIQGQSPWLTNLQVQYERAKQGISLNFLYNAVGPRITEVGTAGRPDIYEGAFHQFDIVASKKISAISSVHFKAKNLFDPLSQSTQGAEIVKSYRKGRSIGVSYQAVF
jgi:outer membrane receptor protein involved in Fe transport